MAHVLNELPPMRTLTLALATVPFGCTDLMLGDLNLTRVGPIPSKWEVNVFRTRPGDGPYTDYSSSHLQKGAEYHEAFDACPGRALMWALEQRAIPTLLNGLVPRTALDFATGTGRIARLLKKQFPDCRVVGTDISEQMLSVAKAEGGDVEYQQLDVRNATEELRAESFDLATAFRFFPNAEPALRSAAADQLSRLVKPGGFALTNNHMNFWSPTYIGQRILNRGPAGMLNGELIDLFTSRGFEIERHVSLGLFPHTEEKSTLPWGALRAFERLNCKLGSSIHSAGYNTLYLFKRAV
jgi:SAM-dependent methyltransferase